ncbi:hypothetical protein U9M48_025104 [Paspalum notatum var. saurae]|uniref:Phytocyanin domain-containing protein n=1 Tax=Paspalum notatum var. saurae TaxID=547442 RepID=A0AAQ3TSL5_PASNO
MAAPPTPTSFRMLALAAILAVVLAAVAAAAAGKRYRVGGAAGWVVPPPEGKEKYYADWASTIAFHVDDSLEFVYANDSVIRVGKAGYYHCNETAGAAPRDGSTVFVLDAPGDAYFASADLGHCKMGQRLAVTVLPGGGGGQAPLAPSSSPWSSAPGPWSWVLSPSSSSVQRNSAAASSSAHAVIFLLVVPTAMALALALAAPGRFV